MIDKLLEIGSTFDWISPIVAAIQDLACGGRCATFFIPDDCGYSGYELCHYIEQRLGVRPWGRMSINGSIMFTVPEEAADAVAEALSEAEIPWE